MAVLALALAAPGAVADHDTPLLAAGGTLFGATPSDHDRVYLRCSGVDACTGWGGVDGDWVLRVSSCEDAELAYSCGGFSGALDITLWDANGDLEVFRAEFARGVLVSLEHTAGDGQLEGDVGLRAVAAPLVSAGYQPSWYVWVIATA